MDNGTAAAKSEPGFGEWLGSHSANVNSQKSLAVQFGAARRFATANGYSKPFLKMTVAEATKLGAAMREREFSRSVVMALRSFLLHHDLTKQAKQFKFGNRKMKRMAPDTLLTTDEVNALMDASNNLRDRALIAVTADTGARISEVCALKLKDVKTEEQKRNGTKEKVTLLWIGKRKVVGSEGFVSFLHPETAVILKAWTDSYPASVKGGDERPLFPSHAASHYGRHMNSEAWHGRIKDIAVKAGIKKNVHMHLLRHYMATWMLRAGYSPAMVAERGGWKDLQMMGRYSHLVSRDVHNEILRRNGYDVEAVPMETLKVPVSKVPAMPPAWTPGNINLEAMVEKKLKEIVAQGGLIVKPGGGIDLAADDGGPGD